MKDGNFIGPVTARLGVADLGYLSFHFLSRFTNPRFRTTCSRAAIENHTYALTRSTPTPVPSRYAQDLYRGAATTNPIATATANPVTNNIALRREERCASNRWAHDGQRVRRAK